MLSCSNRFGSQGILQDLCCTFSYKILTTSIFLESFYIIIFSLNPELFLLMWKKVINWQQLLTQFLWCITTFYIAQRYFYLYLFTFPFFSTVKVSNHYQKKKGGRHFKNIWGNHWICFTIKIPCMWITLSGIYTPTRTLAISYFLLITTLHTGNSKQWSNHKKYPMLVTR